MATPLCDEAGAFQLTHDGQQPVLVAQVGVSVSIQGSRMCSLWDGECICVCVCVHMRDISKGDKVNPSGDQCNPHPFLKGQSGLKQ